MSIDKINQTRQLVSEINRLHLAFSNDYFETGKVAKINLSRTIRHVPASPIYQYRLTLHECINDYLMTANIDIKYSTGSKPVKALTIRLHVSQCVKINIL